jgi:hypothetical protein
VSRVRYELGFICQKTTFFIVTALRTSGLRRVPYVRFPNRRGLVEGSRVLGALTVMIDTGASH